MEVNRNPFPKTSDRGGPSVLLHWKTPEKTCLYQTQQAKSKFRRRFLNVNTYVTKVFLTRWCLRGTGLQKTTFQVEFSDKNCTIDKIRQIMIICEKKVEKHVPFQNGGHFTDFRSA